MSILKRFRSTKRIEEREVVRRTDNATLVQRAIAQHHEKDNSIVEKTKGFIRPTVDQENQIVVIEFADGEVWEYKNVEAGADGMEYRRLR